MLDMGINDQQLEALAAHLSAGKIALAVELEEKTPEGTPSTDDALIARVQEDLKPFQVEIVQQ